MTAPKDDLQAIRDDLQRRDTEEGNQADRRARRQRLVESLTDRFKHLISFAGGLLAPEKCPRASSFFSDLAHSLLAFNETLREADREYARHRILERLERAARAGVPALDTAASLLLLEPSTTVERLACDLERFQGRKPHDEWPMWLTYILDQLLNSNRSPLKDNVPPDTTREEWRKAELAFGCILFSDESFRVQQDCLDQAACVIDDALKCGGHSVLKRPPGRVRDLIAHFDPRALHWYGSEFPPLRLLQPPASIEAITEPESLRRKMDEVWTAANSLQMALDKWAAWFVELQEKGDALPGIALNCNDLANRAIKVLLTHRPNVEPFDLADETALLTMLPPIPGWWRPPANGVAEVDNTEQLKHSRVRWQEDREFLDRYYCRPERRHEKAVKLRGAAAQLIDLLKTFPMTAFAIPAYPPFGLKHAMQPSPVHAQCAVPTQTRSEDLQMTKERQLPTLMQKLVSHLAECQRRLSDLRGRQDYFGLTCGMLRLEGAGGTILYEQPFSRILLDRPFHDYVSAAYGETFGVAFYPLAPGVQAGQIPAALASVDAITGEILPLLRELPRPVRERLQLPDSDNWWRVVFHLGWHFSRPFLRPKRRRLLAKDGVPHGRSDETFVQLHGTGDRTDLLPGLIFSDLEHDLCTCSEAALGVIIDALERPLPTAVSPVPEAQAVSVGQQQAFDRLRAEFLAGMQMPMQPLECKLLKLADSFNTPPAREWASLEVGGCAERYLTLSRLNDMQEIAQIRGPATDWFCEVAERAGNVLPACIPDYPILFDDKLRGIGGPHPVMNREPLERWVGFIFATLKKYGHEDLRVWWGTNLGPVSYGLATINRDLFAASVLAIDLAGLTTVAEEAANRERASCSPFSVPSMEEPGSKWVEETTPPPSPPENYTLGRLVDDLRRFGEQYHQSAQHIRQENPVVQQHSRAQLSAFVSQARAFLQGVPGFRELRTLAQSLWGEEISFEVGRRIVDTLVQGSNGSLSAVAAEGLTLAEAASRLTPAHDGDELPATKETAVPPTKKAKRSTERGEGRRKLIAALTKHHQYAEGSCLNLQPIGNNQLADEADVSISTASAFFSDQFDGHAKYKALCRDSSGLVAALKLLNNEFAPYDLYGRRPAGEDDRDNEGDE